MNSPNLPGRLLTLGALVSSLLLSGLAHADIVIENKEVSIAEKNQFKLEDKLKEAARDKKPVVVLFGEQENPDLNHLYQELREEDSGAMLLVIDPALEGKDSPLHDHIDEEIGAKRGLNTAVFGPKLNSTGKLALGKAGFSKWGYSNGITDDINKAIQTTQSSLGPQASPTNTGINQVPNSSAGAGSTARTVSEARKDLLQAAATRNLDLKRLESRLDELEKRAPGNSVNRKQIIAAYDSVSMLLDSQAKSADFDRNALDYLAELTLHNLARPRSIDQGNHPTCNVTTLEVYLAARHPGVYADLVKQVALTGSYLTSQQEKISPPKAAILPGLDEKSYDIDLPPSNKRNHASQLVQMTLVNGVYQTGRYHEKVDRNGNKVDRRNRHYIVGPPVKTYFRVGNQWAYTTDEDQLLDGNGKPVIGQNGKAIRNPNLIGDDILAASEMVLGYKMPYLEAPYMITGQPWVYDLPTAKRLLKYKADGSLPLGVHTMGGMHVQTIHDVLVKNGTCWILIDNQRGAKEDGWITLDTLHKTQKSMNYQFTPHKKVP